MFESKLDTDLFDMAKAKTCPISIDVSPKDGKLWAALCTDRKIRIFRFLSGKLYLVSILLTKAGYFVQKA